MEQWNTGWQRSVRVVQSLRLDKISFLPWLIPIFSSYWPPFLKFQWSWRIFCSSVAEVCPGIYGWFMYFLKNLLSWEGDSGGETGVPLELRSYDNILSSPWMKRLERSVLIHLLLGFQASREKKCLVDFSPLVLKCYGSALHMQLWGLPHPPPHSGKGAGLSQRSIVSIHSADKSRNRGTVTISFPGKGCV